MRHWFRSITTFVLTLALLVSMLPAQVSLAATGQNLTDDQALALLKEYNIVRGDPQGNVNVTDRLTRAQAAALFVRAIGMESLVPILKDLVLFSDAKGHWAAGEIAAAERLGLMRGDPSGLFRPEDDITYAEVLTVLLRLVEQEPVGQWNPDRIVTAARTLGIMPVGVSAQGQAIRGRIFWALAMTLSDVEVGGRTLLQKHYDQEAPVLRLDRTDMITQDSSVTIVGTTVGAARVLVQGEEASLDRNTGRFTGQATVNTGSTTVEVEAYDWAGNKAIATVTVERKAQISRLKIVGPSYVVARSSTPLTIEATDSRGNAIENLQDVEVEITGDVATFNLESKTLRAGSEAGRGTLTLRAGNARATYNFNVYGPSSSVKRIEFAPINNNRGAAIDDEVTVTVRAVAENGAVVGDDYGRTISLQSTGLSGISINPSQATTEKGLATFKVKGSRLGQAQLEAKSTGLDSVTKSLDIVTDVYVTLTATTGNLKPDGTTTTVIKATLYDKTGKAITNNTTSDMQIDLTATGTDGELLDGYLTIPRGKSTSTGNDGLYRVGVAPGTVKVVGQFASTHTNSIQPLTLDVTNPLAGARLALTSSPASTAPKGSVTLTLRVQDSSGRAVSTGSYAFGLKVTTSNDDPIVNGLPEGVQLTFQNSDYTPVDDGRSSSDPFNDELSVVGRTDRGTATFTLTYNRSGVVTVTPVLKPVSYEAYHPTTGMGAASASTEMSVGAVNVTFAGTPAAIELTATSDLGVEQKGAATNTAKTVRIQAKVVDSTGAVVPTFGSTITLTREAGGDGVSNITGSTRRTAVNGVAEFTVQTTSTEGYDLYRATGGDFTSRDLTVAVHKGIPEPVTVVAIRGIKEGDLSPVVGYVGPDADYMDIQLDPMRSPLGGEPTYWVKAKVYRKGERNPLFTSDAIDLSGGVPIIRIPKSALTQTGEFYYEVVVNDGGGDSPRSLALNDISKALNVVYADTYKLTTAKYDAETKKLTLTGTLATGAQIDTSRIRFVKGDEEVSLGDATITSLSSSTLVLTLGASADQIDPAVFYGTVSIKADDGWFTTSDRSKLARPQTVTVTPMANVTHAELDTNASRRLLYLYGDGLKQATVRPASFTIVGADAEVKLTTSDSVTSTADGRVLITLSTASFNAVMQLTGPLHVTATTGWMTQGTGTSAVRVGALTGTDRAVYLAARISSASYDVPTNTLTLSGTFFVDGVLDPSQLTFRRATTGSTWSPSSTADVTVTSTTNVQIVLSDADAAALESQFSGKSLYLNTLEGWLTDSLGREAALNANNSAIFTVPQN